MKKFLLDKIFNLYHLLWAALSAVFYRFPSNRLIVIGVTGTTGKSTTVEMIAAVLEKAGYKVASSSSIRFKVAGEFSENLMKQTMPGRGFLQKFLRGALRAGCRYAVVEVTSEGIRQYRHRFINFDVAVLTNLAPEHIESHGGFENYKNAKLDLFRETAESATKFIDGKPIKKFVILNKETPNFSEFNNFSGAEKIIFGPSKNPGLNLKMIGDFWKLNADAALAVARSQNIDENLSIQALNAIGVISGRMEEIDEGQNFRVFVDYAHTPGSLEAVYKTLKNLLHPKSSTLNPKLICVLGAAGGGRDKWKRPEFGKLAWQYCDEIILTNEDPYDESPEAILDQIASGIPASKSYRKILERREAIQRSIDLAHEGDVVVITGKGCEPWMIAGGDRKIPWDDRKVARECLEEKKSA